MNEEESKEKYMKFQIMQQHMMQLQNQLEELNRQKSELNYTIKAIEEFSKTKGEKKLLTPIASGIFLKSKIDSFNEVLVNVGNGIVVKKKPAGAIKLVQKHLGDIDEVIVQISRKLKEYDLEFIKLQHELEAENV